MTTILHGYWRSTASYRVRIALNLKGVAHAQNTYDLRQGAQRSDAYLTLNAQGLVPALETDGTVLTQSLAILEWLDEVHPTPPLLPATPDARAVVRAMAGLIASDVHPLNNLRVLNALRGDLAASEAQVQAWIARWIAEGFSALERLVERHGGAFAFGDTPTLADCCLIPQIIPRSASRWISRRFHASPPSGRTPGRFRPSRPRTPTASRTPTRLSDRKSLSRRSVLSRRARTRRSLFSDRWPDRHRPVRAGRSRSPG